MGISLNVLFRCTVLLISLSFMGPTFSLPFTPPRKKHDGTSMAGRRSERLPWGSCASAAEELAAQRSRSRSRPAEELVARWRGTRGGVTRGSSESLGCGGARPVDPLALQSRSHRGLAQQRTQQSPRAARRAADRRRNSRPQSLHAGGVLDAMIWWNESMLSVRVSYYFQCLGNNADTFHGDETFPFSLLLVSCNLLMWHLI